MGGRLKPFLMFQGGVAEAAMNSYAAVFPGARIIDITRYGPGAQGPEGTVMRASIEIGGETLMCFDSPIEHAFGFTPSLSLFYECESEAELERIAAALLDGGAALMPPDNYGFSQKFAWVNDRFGVSWQLNLA